jgi:hypothetical protein
VAEHLEGGCPECEDDLAELRKFARSQQTSHAPAEEARSGVGEVVDSLVRIVAGPVSGARTPALGVCGVISGSTLVYAAGLISITLTARKDPAADPRQFTLNGLLAWEEHESADLAGAGVRLLSTDADERASTLDSLASFRFDDLSLGTYSLEARCSASVIRIDDIALTE